MPLASEDSLEGILETITPIERRIFGRAIRKVTQSPNATTYRGWVPKFGPGGSVHLFLSGRWRGISGLVGIVAVALLILGQLNHKTILVDLSLPVYAAFA